MYNIFNYKYLTTYMYFTYTELNRKEKYKYVKFLDQKTFIFISDLNLFSVASSCGV